MARKRLSRTRREAKKAYRADRAAKVFSNTAQRSQPDRLDKRTRAILSGQVFRSGAPVFALDPLNWKANSHYKGCVGARTGGGMRGVNQASISRFISGQKAPKEKAKRFKVWSQPIPQDEVSGMIQDGQAKMLERESFIADLGHQGALALHTQDTREKGLLDAMPAIRVIDTLAAMVRRKRRKSRVKSKA